MKLFNIIWEDVNCDTEVLSYGSYPNALAYAEKVIKETYLDNGISVNFKVDVETKAIMKMLGWIYFAEAQDLFTLRIEETELL